MSVHLLSKVKELVFLSDRVVWLKIKLSWEQSHCSNGFSVTNVETFNEIGLSSSAYIVEFIDTWHSRLGYLNVETLKE